MFSNELKLHSKSDNETIKYGIKMGELLKSDQIILLSGELGAGKTKLVKGVAEGLGIKDEVNSPTFTLIHEYQGRIPLFHMDLYRLKEEEELYDIGFEEYLERDGAVIIEWPELALNLMPSDAIFINIEVSSKDSRIFYISSREKKNNNIIEGLTKYVDYGD